MKLLIACTLAAIALKCEYSWGAGPSAAKPHPESNASARAVEDNPNQIRALRLFSEPLLRLRGRQSAADDADLLRALRLFEQRTVSDDFSLLEEFAFTHPDSAWTPSLLFNLAFEYYNTGWYSKCLRTWERAWPLLQSETHGDGKAIADRALGELAYMYARLGRMEDLEKLFRSIEGRPLVGAATERIAGAKQGLWTMQHWPGVAFKCGPFALQQLLGPGDGQQSKLMILHEAKSTTNGCSLSQVAELSRQVGLNYQTAYRSHGAPLLMPAVVHWKLGHYAALLREVNGKYLLKDPTFGNDTWISRRALDEESSGYFLVPTGDLPAGWRAASAAEANRVFGKGITQVGETGSVTWLDWFIGLISGTFQGNSCPGTPMAAAGVHLMLVSLHVEDTPISYRPPVGDPITFRVSYNQREANQPSTFRYANLGPKWTFNWLAYITDYPGDPLHEVSFFTEGGGSLAFTGFDPDTQTFAPQKKSLALLKRTSTNSYEMLYRDGSRIIFDRPFSTNTTIRPVFMTQKIDPAGNVTSINLDSAFRVTSITDAVGQVSSIAYEHPNDSNKVTKVTDPFGRFATFDYDTNGRLVRITDPIQIKSEFVYDAGDFIQALKTPYGTNHFEKGEAGRTRWLTITHVDGARERVEYNEYTTTGIDMIAPPSQVPAGMGVANNYLCYRNTFHWDRKAYAEAPNDYTKAHLYHWLHQDLSISSGILESEKRPLENRVWRTYDFQGLSVFEGTNALPGAIGRVLDDGTTQLMRFRYDWRGQLTNAIDPLGRSISLRYATNGIDLLEVRQTTGTNDELLARFLYNNQHRPVATWDASGQMTTNSFNARGQLMATTNPKGETTSFNYNAAGYLLSVNGPLPGNSDIVAFAYDATGRVSSVTGTDGYSVTNLYDNIDRLVRVTYPDGTFTSATFSNLDLVLTRDRNGRDTRYTYDALRRPVTVEDPLHRLVRFEYCDCGSLSTVIDPMERPTRWHYDLQGRVTAKEYVDRSRVLYTYENTTSRLKSVQDEKGQFKHYEYFLDDTLKRTSYPNAEHYTPTVSFTYDPNYRRLLTMRDGIGETRYGYHPINGIPAPGAGRLASVDGPFANDTVTYAYDELGRPLSRAIDGVAVAVNYDALGRVVQQTNALGSFAYHYVNATRRLSGMDYPNGQRAVFNYFDNLHDRRLEEIKYLTPGNAILSKFNYTYDAVGQILSWTQQSGTNAPEVWNYGYDLADQLIAANVTASGSPVKGFSYSYDLAGNRLSEVEDGATNRFTYNALNEIVSQAPVSAIPARSFEWDAENRLLAIVQGTNRSEFQYDGYGRRVRIAEMSGAIVSSDAHYLWCAANICEVRGYHNGAVQKRYFGQGMSVSAQNHFYSRDHLGSIREMTDAGGTVRARNRYAPFGARTGTQGDLESDFLFTGHFQHKASGLFLTYFRAYESTTARWVSRDPIGEFGGINLYAYVVNDPINGTDPLGLKACFLDRLKEIAIMARPFIQKYELSLDGQICGGRGLGGCIGLSWDYKGDISFSWVGGVGNSWGGSLAVSSQYLTVGDLSNLPAFTGGVSGQLTSIFGKPVGGNLQFSILNALGVGGVSLVPSLGVGIGAGWAVGVGSSHVWYNTAGLLGEPSDNPYKPPPPAIPFAPEVWDLWSFPIRR